MKLDCKIIQDLIPLVNDDIASEQSKILVSEHCKDCSVCNDFLGGIDMKNSINNIQIENDIGIIKSIKQQIVFSKTLFAGIGILLASMVWGLVMVQPSISYTLLTFLFVMPITSFVVTLILAIKDLWWKWLFPVISGAIGVLTYFLWFSELAGITLVFFVTIFPAVMGLGIGEVVRFSRRKFAKSKGIEATVQEKVKVKSNTKAIISALVCVVIFMATSFVYDTYVSNGRTEREHQVYEHLMNNRGYSKDEIQSVRAEFSLLSAVLGYKSWVVNVEFTDDPDLVYHYDYDEKVCSWIQSSFSGGEGEKEDIIEKAKHLEPWINHNPSPEEIPVQTDENGLGIPERAPGYDN